MSHTRQCSTEKQITEDSQEASTAFRYGTALGARSSNAKKLTYEDIFYRRYKEGRKEGRRAVRLCDNPQHLLQRRAQEYTGSQCEKETGVRRSSSKAYGFPISINRGQWCQRLKLFSESPKNEGRKINIVQYLGIAADETARIKKHIGKPNIVLPLVEIGWEEDMCGLISGYQDLLSPSYDTAERDGCWFCHNQGVGQLRLLRRNYPDLWQLLLKWDDDSPVTFKPDGRTVHDFDERFALEDAGLISEFDPWRWAYLKRKATMQISMRI